MRNFGDWFATFKKTINAYDYFTDFNKIYGNVDEIKIELNILNSLVGSHNIESDFRLIYEKYPEIIRCIPILLAVRKSEISVMENETVIDFDFQSSNLSVDDCLLFMKKTGLLDLLSNHIVNNLVDYVLGVETGLDSNSRKNRGGKQMEKLVENFISKCGVEYYSQMKLQDVEEKWGVDLSSVSGDGTTTKRWDFVVKTENNIFLMETNFYASGGSKLNETARSYKMIANEVENIDGVQFIWVTDGLGWEKAKNNLEDTFNSMTHLYNINDLKNGALVRLFEF